MSADTKKGLSREELKTLITEMATDIATKAVDELIKPHKSQSTNWFDQLNGKAPAARHYDTKKDSPFGRFIMSLANGKSNQDSSYQWAKKAFGTDDIVTKTLEAGNFTSAGALVEGDVLQDVIDVLRNRSIWRALGTTNVPMPKGQTEVPVWETSPTAQYIAEGAVIPTDEPTVGRKVLTPKKLGVQVPLTLELMEFSRASGMDAAANITNDIAKVLATTETATLIENGTGLASTPVSLLRQATNAGRVTAANTTVTLATATSELFAMLNQLASANVDPPFAWLMTQRTFLYLQSVRDTNGASGFANMLTVNGTTVNMNDPVGTLLGFPVYCTNAISNNHDGSNSSRIYLVAPSEIMFGEVPVASFQTSDTASFVDTDAATKSAWDRDLVLIKGRLWHDALLKHDESLYVYDTVRYISA